MSLKEKFDEYKIVLGIVAATVTATASVVAWVEVKASQAEQQMQEELIQMKAQSALIHNDYYQNGRIERKEIEIKENRRELNLLLKTIGDNEPSARQKREIEYLDQEILRLRKEIEEIRVTLAQR